MARIFFIAVFASLNIFTSSAFGFNTYQVGEVVKGRAYNKVWKQWFTKQLVLRVGIDEKGTEYLLFEAETGLGPASTLMEYDPKMTKLFQVVTSKAIKWSKVAKKNKADTSKPILCIGAKCTKRSNVFMEGKLDMSFFSANGGKQTDLIVEIIDRGNQFITSTLYVDPSGMRTLLNNVSRIDATFEKARKTQSKQALFK